jgi:integrase
MVERAGAAAKLGFKAHRHMLRHACGFALANKGHDTRALQAYLGHKNIQHTVATLSWRRIASMTSGAKVDPGLGSCRTVMAGRALNPSILESAIFL